MDGFRHGLVVGSTVLLRSRILDCSLPVQGPESKDIGFPRVGLRCFGESMVDGSSNGSAILFLDVPA